MKIHTSFEGETDGSLLGFFEGDWLGAVVGAVEGGTDGSCVPPGTGTGVVGLSVSILGSVGSAEGLRVGLAWVLCEIRK